MTPSNHSAASNEKLLQYLHEAHATELALTRTLEAHIAMTPHGSYRSGLDKHLAETRDHAARIERRLSELGDSRSILRTGVGLARGFIGQALALSKGPVDLVRGNAGEEKLLKNAKDECATEALEIATYDALEHLARYVGDEQTAKLAASIRADEERMLAKLRAELPKLTEAMARSEIGGEPSYDVSTTGAADAVRAGGKKARETAKRADASGRKAARQARKVPGVAQVEGQVKGAVADEADIPIADYDKQNAADIVARLPELSQIDLAKVDSYERKHAGRKGVLEKVNSLRGDEPWPGYDELTADEVRQALGGLEEKRVSEIRDYERRHKGRKQVLEASERELAEA